MASPVHEGWTAEHYLRLCQLTHLTPRELSALVCVPWCVTDRILRSRRRFSPVASLHFAIIESVVMGTAHPMPMQVLA